EPRMRAPTQEMAMHALVSSHPTSPASPGHPHDTPTGSAPHRPPWWRPWLIPLGIAVTLWLLLPILFRGPPGLTYTQFLEKVDQGRVASVTIEANGEAHGRLE